MHPGTDLGSRAGPFAILDLRVWAENENPNSPASRTQLNSGYSVLLVFLSYRPEGRGWADRHTVSTGARPVPEVPSEFIPQEPLYLAVSTVCVCHPASEGSVPGDPWFLLTHTRDSVQSILTQALAPQERLRCPGYPMGSHCLGMSFPIPGGLAEWEGTVRIPDS